MGPGAYNPKFLDSSYKKISFGYKLDSAFEAKQDYIPNTN
jgi:hypothetical protein